MTIYQPLCFHEIGKRPNQEDSLFPSVGQATETDHTFIVCDGMGGHANGEVASSTICTAFASFLNGMDHESFSKSTFKRALAFAYDELDRVGASSDMGTTLTFLHLNSHGALMAHIGDSRIYHLRPDSDGNMKILYRSSDHSLVGELLSAGIISEEEAANHPKKNVITRAMQPSDHSDAEIHTTSDVKSGDYFFLCTDGVLESVDDTTLAAILSNDISDEDKLDQIKTNCAAASRDNHTAYLIRVAASVTTASMSHPLVSDNELPTAAADKRQRIIRLAIVIAVCLTALFLILHHFDIHITDIISSGNDSTATTPTTTKLPTKP